METHIALAVSIELRKRGLDVVRSHEVGLADVSDSVHLAYAAGEKRSIVTNDRDFLLLHRQYLTNGLFHAGIFLVLGNPYSIGDVVTEILEFEELLVGGTGTLENIHNHLLFIKRRNG